MVTSGCGHSYLDAYRLSVKGGIRSEAYKWQGDLVSGQPTTTTEVVDSWAQQHRICPECWQQSCGAVNCMPTDFCEPLEHHSTSKILLPLLHLQTTTSHFDISIISGRLKDQPAKESKSHHGIQLPAKVGVFRVPGKNLPEGVEKENRPETLSPDRSKSRQRLHRAPVMVTEPSKNDRKPRTGLRPKVAISIVKNLDLPSHHYIFFTILSFILKWVYIFRYFN